MDELGNVVNVDVVLAEQRMVEGDGDAAVGVFDIEDDSVAADFTPMADDANPVLAARHDAGEVNGSDLEVPGDGNCLLGDRRRQGCRG